LVFAGKDENDSMPIRREATGTALFHRKRPGRDKGTHAGRGIRHAGGIRVPCFCTREKRSKIRLNST
jgi:hypothetical protein